MKNLPELKVTTKTITTVRSEIRLTYDQIVKAPHLPKNTPISVTISNSGTWFLDEGLTLDIVWTETL